MKQRNYHSSFVSIVFYCILADFFVFILKGKIKDFEKFVTLSICKKKMFINSAVQK